MVTTKKRHPIFLNVFSNKYNNGLKKSGNTDLDPTGQDLMANEAFLTEECLEILEPVNVERENPENTPIEEQVVVPPAPSNINAMTGSLDVCLLQSPALA